MSDSPKPPASSGEPSAVSLLAAEQEASAQLEIVRALSKLDGRENCILVIEAICHLLEAEKRIPGIMNAVVLGFRRRTHARRREGADDSRSI